MMQTFFRKYAVFAFVLIIILWSWALSQRPLHNWDMIGYMAVVLEYEMADKEVIHQRVYKIVEEEVPDQFDLLTAGAYRQKCSMDKDFFFDQLTFYRVKPLYTAIVYLLHKSGISLVRSTTIPSIVSFGLLIILFYLLLLKETKSVTLAISISILIALFEPLISLARFASPDGLSNLIVFAVLYAFYKKKKTAIFILLVISVFARIDNLILAGVISIFLLFDRYQNGIHWKKKLIIAGVVLSGVTMIFLFFSTIVGNQIQWLSNYKYLQSVPGYFHSIYKSVTYVTSSSFPLILIFLLVCYNFISDKFKTILKIIGCTIAIRLLLFPLFNERFFVAFELIAIISILTLINSRLWGLRDYKINL